MGPSPFYTCFQVANIFEFNDRLKRARVSFTAICNVSTDRLLFEAHEAKNLNTHVATRAVTNRMYSAIILVSPISDKPKSFSHWLLCPSYVSQSFYVCQSASGHLQIASITFYKKRQTIPRKVPL